MTSQYDPTLDEPRAPEREPLPDVGTNIDTQQDEDSHHAPPRDNIERPRGQGSTGGLDMHSWFSGPEDVIQPGADPLDTISHRHPVQEARDDALQVYDIKADFLNTGRFILLAAPAAPVQIAWANPNRLSVRIFNETGGQSIVIAQTYGKAGVTSGFLIPAGTTVTMDYTGDLYAAPFTGSTGGPVSVVELIRNTNRA